MKLEAESYRGKLRDPRLESEIASELRALDEAQAFEFLMELIDVHLLAALELAGRCLRKREYFLSILDRGLREGNASTIRHWIECVSPHLGIRRLINRLRLKIEEHPQGVSRAAYFVKQSVTADDRRSQDALGALLAELDKFGISRGPKVVVEDGRILFAPIESRPARCDDTDGENEADLVDRGNS